MSISIRKFLLINLLLAVTLTTTLTAIGNYYIDRKDIQRHLDSFLLLATLSYEALLGHDIKELPLDDIQESINSIRKRVDMHYDMKHITRQQQNYVRQFDFQVWTEKNELLLSSIDSPGQRLSNKENGFSDETINGGNWRTFTSYNPNNKTYTIVGERYESRNELARHIAKDDFYIIMLTFPISGLLIWIIIGRSLRSLTRIAVDLSTRAATYFVAVDPQGVPLEIKPVIVAINKLLFRLRDAFEREKRFAADAAHELKTPLAALKTQAQVALRSQDPKERETALNNVIAGVDRSSHIIQQLLTLSRLLPEVPNLDDIVHVNLPKLTAEIIAQLAPMALDKNIDIELICERDDLTVEGNMTALSILIRNLVDNAIRYTPEGGAVKAIVERINERVELIISDTGPGIPAELRSRVFERFFRVLGNKSPGSGLGLAIVQQIAKLHNAEIILESLSEGKKGLRIKIIFPTSLFDNSLG